MTEQNNQLALATPKPRELFAVTTATAGVCKEIVSKTAVEIKGRKHVCVEGWQSIAAAMGHHLGAGNVRREFDEDGMLLGWKADGYVRNGLGVIIGTGEGFVGVDEKDNDGNQTWGKRAEYAARAMAQTRAMSRAGKGVFSFVVVLMEAGLDTTPAEEADPTRGAETAAKAAVQHQGQRRGGPDAPIYDWREEVVPFGKNKGKKLGELQPKSLEWYQNKDGDGWKPTPRNGQLSKADARLQRALRISLGQEQPDKRPETAADADAGKTEVVGNVPENAKQADAGPFNG